MNDASRKADLQKALAEWKKKHHVVSDNDPHMAFVELWEILMENSRAADPGQLFRHELEQLTEIGKTFSKQSGEVVCELRSVPKIKNDLWLFPYFTVALVAVLTLIIGMFIGKLFL